MSICVVVMIKALLTIRAEQKRIKELENRLDESYRKMEDNLKKLQPRITPQEMMDRTINRVLKNLKQMLSTIYNPPIRKSLFKHSRYYKTLSRKSKLLRAEMQAYIQYEIDMEILDSIGYKGRDKA